MVRIQFTQGTLRIEGSEAALEPIRAWIVRDDRVGCHRAEGRHYGPILLTLHRRGLPFQDEARGFAVREFSSPREPSPRPHQQAALAAWQQAGRCGVVVLPTGSGKSLVARMAIALTRRDTLVVVPTLDLMHQWYEQLVETFGQPVGLLGGGERTLGTITVSTYDSALIHMEWIGNRFGLLICDECHHLPTPSTRMVAVMSIAPFRLGLTATPERTDGQESELYQLLGPLCHRSEITELSGSWLAPYRHEALSVPLDPDEREVFDAARDHYRQFARNQGFDFRRPNEWTKFVLFCARSPEGRTAYDAYRLQSRLAQASRAKLRVIWQLLTRHRQEQWILFTNDNATAYAIGATFLLPVITHHTRLSERKEYLELFRQGRLSGLVNSRVLNEGVDIPSVAVGIIVSGNSTVREHVQRLGRLLRPGKDKQAVLYELVSEDTGEMFTSERRRQHVAYQPAPFPPC